MKVIKLKQENSNLMKQLEILNDQNNKLKVESMNKQDKCQQLEIQLLQQKQEFQTKISNLEQKYEQELSIYKQQHLDIVNEQFQHERDEQNAIIHQLRLEKDQLVLQIARLEHQAEISTRDYNHQINILDTELQNRKGIISQLQGQNQDLSTELSKLKVDLKQAQNDMLNYHLQRDQENKDLKNQHEYENSQNELKLNVLIKENDKLMAQVQQLEQRFQAQLLDLENYHRAERKKLAMNEATHNYLQIVKSSASSDQKVQLLMEELANMNERLRLYQVEIALLKDQKSSEYAKLRKDNELWMVNTQEILKEKEDLRAQMEQEYVSKLRAIESQYEETIARMRAGL